MLFFLMVFGLCFGSETGSVDLYQPLFPRNFAEGDHGTFYILDPSEHQVRHYSKEIQVVKAFGGQGEGPGEFFFPSSIHYLNGVVYVEDSIFFTLFKPNGEPQGKIRKPFDADWAPTGYSWIARRRIESEGIEEIIWFSKDLSQKKILHVDRDTSFLNDSFNPEGRPIPPAFSRGKHRLAIADKERFSIQVFDTYKGTLLHVIEKNVKLVPYDREWGEASAKKMLSMLLAYEALASKPDTFSFPEYFPPILRLDYTVDNHLIAFGLLRPGRIKPDFAFNLEGKPIPLKGDPEDYIYKVMMQNEGFAYLNRFANDEVFIRKVPLKKLAATLAAEKEQ